MVAAAAAALLFLLSTRIKSLCRWLLVQKCRCQIVREKS